MSISYTHYPIYMCADIKYIIYHTYRTISILCMAQCSAGCSFGGWAGVHALCSGMGPISLNTGCVIRQTALRSNSLPRTDAPLQIGRTIAYDVPITSPAILHQSVPPLIPRPKGFFVEPWLVGPHYVYRPLATGHLKINRCKVDRVGINKGHVSVVQILEIQHD